MSEREDTARPVRAGEELDAARLGDFLLLELGLDPRGIEVLQFPGGHSNLTYLVRIAGRELVLRRPPFGSKVRAAHDMGREVRVLSRLAAVWPKAPAPLCICEDESVLGAKFYVMEWRRGLIIRRALPDGLTLAPDEARRLCDELVDTLVELHQLDYRALGLEDFGKPLGYVERQVRGWTERYQGSRTDDIPEVITVARWLAEHLPTSPPPTILHNDYKLDNVVLDPADPTHIVGVLDWEMSTLGDPLMDLGTALCYWVEPDDGEAMQALGFGPTTLPGMMTRERWAARYAERAGRDLSLSQIVFYYVFGLFKTAVVAQQIYYRYAHGLTRDERFARMLLGVRILAGQAARAIEHGRLGQG